MQMHVISWKICNEEKYLIIKFITFDWIIFTKPNLAINISFEVERLSNLEIILYNVMINFGDMH